MPWREAVFSELEYSFHEARRTLGCKPGTCRGLMVRTDDWKYVDWQGYAPQPWNLREEPAEFVDLGEEPGLEAVHGQMRARLLAWLAALKIRTTMGDAEVEARTNPRFSGGCSGNEQSVQAGTGAVQSRRRDRGVVARRASRRRLARTRVHLPRAIAIA